MYDDRYARQIILPQVGEAGQRRLSESSVLVVGAGGLGVPVLMYLAAAGVGRITIVDPDRVELSNLHRQVLYTEADIGRPKADVAAEALAARNSEIEIRAHRERLDEHNAESLISGHDLVIDGSDNIETRYVLDDACLSAGVAWVHASIHRFEGQVSCFNVNGGPRYRDLFPTPPKEGSVPSCAEAGVLGALPGMLGAIQAAEALKLLLGTGESLAGKVLVVNANTMSFRSLDLSMSEAKIEQSAGPHNLNAAEAEKRRQSGWKPFVIDVRQPSEVDIASLPFVDLNVDFRHIGDCLDQIPQQGDIMLYCHHGQRSSMAIGTLISLGLDAQRLFNLAGGIDAWATLVDASIRRY